MGPDPDPDPPPPAVTPDVLVGADPPLPPPPTNDVDPASDCSEVADAGVKVEKVADMSENDEEAAAELEARTLSVVRVVVMLEVTTEADMATE